MQLQIPREPAISLGSPSGRSSLIPSRRQAQDLAAPSHIVLVGKQFLHFWEMVVGKIPTWLLGKRFRPFLLVV